MCINIIINDNIIINEIMIILLLILMWNDINDIIINVWLLIMCVCVYYWKYYY